MDWRDDGFVLSARLFGERDAVAHLLTREHGRHAGLVRGGASRTKRAFLELGSEVQASWRGRLEDHLGTFDLEPVAIPSARLLDRPAALTALSSACAMLDACLADREPHPQLHEALRLLIVRLLADDDWPEAYVRFELILLAELGFALDLSSCALSGETSGLAYVSPRTGRAVTEEAGRPWADKLLKLPRFLIEPTELTPDQIADGLRLCGYFLDRHLLEPADRPVPAIRDRLAARFAGGAATTDDEKESA